MTTIRELITATANSQLNKQDTVTVGGIEEEIRRAVERRKDLHVKLDYLSPAFEYNPDFTVAEACQWLERNPHVSFAPQTSCAADLPVART